MAPTAASTDIVRTDIFETLAMSDENIITVAVIPERDNILLRIQEYTKEFEQKLQWIPCLIQEVGQKLP